VTLSNSLPTLAAFEGLFVNNADLDKIEAYLNRFNPISVMRMENMENRHSNILAWLLDPKENHGLGDKFARAFLAEAMRSGEANDLPSALEVAQADLNDLEVRREWLHIDLFLLSRRNGWAFVIENKFYAKQGDGQLEGYKRKVRSVYSSKAQDIKIGGIFLTLNDEQPDDLDFVAIGYEAIATLLPRILESESDTMGDEVAIFVRHYIDIVKEACGMSDEQEKMEQLARSLYRRHQKVLDFIWEHGSQNNFTIARESAFGSEWGDDVIVPSPAGDLVSLTSGSEWISFLPVSWFQWLGGRDYTWPGCENWWSGFPVICWMELQLGNEAGKGVLRLYAEVGPLADHISRVSLIRLIEEAAADAAPGMIAFRKGADRDGAQYSRFTRNNTVPIEDVSDHEEIAAAISDLLERFKPAFEAIGPVFDEATGYVEVKMK
jgi:hypothetical protein